MDQNLIINDFLIRYTYTSFITTDDIDLKKLTNALLKNKITRCILNEDNALFWLENDILLHGFAQFSKSEKSYILIDKYRNKIILPPHIDELYKKLVNKRDKEQRIIHNNGSRYYIDFYTDPIKLNRNKSEVTFQPYIKIFKDSITIIKYELKEKNLKINTEDFIKDYVNLISLKHEKIYCSPSLYSMFIESSNKIQKNNILERAITIYNLISSDKEIYKNSKTENINDISQSLIEIPDSQDNSLVNITISLINIIEYQLFKPRNNLLYLMLGYNQKYNNSNLWVGRPYIYIKKYENMKEKGSENNSFYGYNFQYIMSRKISKDSLSIKDDSKLNLRLSDDSLYFSNSGVSLFINSKHLYENGDYKDLLHTLEITEDYLEYGYMIHKALLSLVLLSKTPEEINKLRWKANHLIDFDMLTYYGEVRHWFRECLKARNIEVIKTQTKEAFEIRLQERLYTSDKKNKDLSISLSVIFGLLASVSIAEFIGEPLLKKLDFFNSLDVLWIKSASFFITLFIIWAYIGFIRYKHK